MHRLHLVQGVPHRKHCRIVTNTSQRHRDGHPLSGDGLLQFYNLSGGNVHYSCYKLPLPPGIASKGVNERSVLPLKNFSNTSAIFGNGGELYTLYDYDTYLAQDVANGTYTQGRYKCGVHMKKQENALYSFENSHLDNALILRKDHRIVSRIPLDSMYYIHDFAKVGDLFFFPMYAYDVNVADLLFGKRSVAESVRFNNARPFSLLMVDASTGRSSRLELSYIKGPVFHIVGWGCGSVVKLALFELDSDFQVSHITSKVGYRSKCVIVSFDTHREDHISIQCLVEKGDMPFQDGDRFSYVSDDRLNIVNFRADAVTTFHFPGEQLEEPKMIDGYTYLVSHAPMKTTLRVFGKDNSLQSTYTGAFESEQAFHGDIKNL